MRRPERDVVLELLPTGSVVRIPKADLAPDDVIVFTADEHIPHETAMNVGKALRKLWPRHKIVIIGTPRATITVKKGKG